MGIFNTGSTIYSSTYFFLEKPIVKIRNASVDTLKGILIILVVMGHVSPPNAFIASLVVLIYCFHMPAFFILSGLFVKKDPEKELKGSFIIVIVYAVWLLYSKIHSPASIPKAFLFSNWHELKSILWFLPALFIFKMIMSVSLSHKVFLAIFVATGLLAIIFNIGIQARVHLVPWGIAVALYILPAALLSRLLYNRPKLLQQVSEKFQWLLYFLVFIAALFLFYQFVPFQNISSYRYKLDFAQFTVPSLTGYLFLTVMMLAMVSMGKLRVGNNVLSWIGNRTMPVFLFHYFFITQLSRFTSSSTVAGWLLFIIVPVAGSLAVSAILHKISRKFQYIGA